MIPRMTQTYAAPVPRGGRQFAFTGGAATYFGTSLLALLITILTLGICYPFALVLLQRWRCKHAHIDGQQLQFTGSAWALFGNWIKWFLLILITLGIYSFWVGPRIQRWKWENTSFAAPTIAQPAVTIAQGQLAAAGWYPDEQGGQRYWDGTKWTEQAQS